MFNVSPFFDKNYHSQKKKTTLQTGTYKKHFADGAIFIHGGKTMPVDAFLAWCTGVGKAGSFKNWQWSNVEVRFFL